MSENAGLVCVEEEDDSDAKEVEAFDGVGGVAEVAFPEFVAEGFNDVASVVGGGIVIYSLTMKESRCFLFSMSARVIIVGGAFGVSMS